MTPFRVYQLFLFATLMGMIPGCGLPSAESLSRERLRKMGVQFEKTNVDMPYASIPAAETGRSLVFVPWNMGSGDGWTDADFKRAVDDLRKQVDLDFLMLRLTKITDESMSDVATLTQLRHLNLGSLSVTDDGIAKLGTLKNLEGLYLDGSNQITGVGLRSLKDVPLRKLSLRATTASDETTDALTEFTQLEHLDLGLTGAGDGSTGVGDTTLNRVATLPVLRTLLLDRSAITDEGLRQLRNATTLERLIICINPQINGSAIHEICKLPRMIELNISNTGIKKETVIELRREFPRVKIIW